MPSNNDPQCKTCKHWEARNPVDGNCHRFPPTVVPDAMDRGVAVKYTHPLTLANDWCGEWAKK